MKVTLQWLREFVDLSTLGFDGDPIGSSRDERVVALVSALNELGMVVEGVEIVPAGLDGVVVAEVLEISEIEGADKIRLTRVDDGEGPLRPVVCGAWNFQVGDKVPLAKPGTTLPNGLNIGSRRLKGVASEGMLCSPAEVGISLESGGLLILDASAPVGESLASHLGLEDDVVIDLAIEANRPDANSVIGVARDLAAWLRVSFFEPELVPVTVAEPANPFKVDSALCDRLVTAEFSGVEAASFPAKLARRLELCGMRSISPLVDASNYVMLEIGQPSHPYDLDRLSGGAIAVRAAAPGEQITTLDGIERTLGPEDICIADGRGAPIGIAGIMGGRETEITGGTTRMLLEVAHFDRARIARTSKRLGLRSEASARFERGVDPSIAERAIFRFTQLTGLDVPTALVHASTYTLPEPIWVETRKVMATIGHDDLEALLAVFDRSGPLEAIGLDCQPGEGGFVVTPPLYRPDITGPHDVIEEVARHFGYARVASKMLRGPGVGLTPVQRFERQLRELLVGMGFYESWPATLVAPGEQLDAGTSSGWVALSDPISALESTLRVTVLAGLLRALRYNVARRMPMVNLFEIGPVFSQDGGSGGLPRETRRLAVLAATDGDNGLEAIGSTLASLRDFCRPGALRVAEQGTIGGSWWPSLHPTRSCALLDGNGSVVGVAGELLRSQVAGGGQIPAEQVNFPRYGYLEIDLDFLSAGSGPGQILPPSVYTSSDLDFSFAVPHGVSIMDLHAAVSSALGPLCQDLFVFDRYTPETDGDSYLGLRARLESPEGVIGEAITRKLIESVDAAAAGLGARLRRG